MDEIEQEKLFLKQFALNGYNEYYGQSIKAENCSICSISPAYNCTHGYVIRTLDSDDFVEIRLYFKFGQTDRIDVVRLENVNLAIDGTNNLNDEVTVVLATLNQTYRDYGCYKFRWMQDEYSMSGLIQFESSSGYLYLQSGHPLRFVQVP